MLASQPLQLSDTCPKSRSTTWTKCTSKCAFPSVIFPLLWSFKPELISPGTLKLWS